MHELGLMWALAAAYLAGWHTSSWVAARRHDRLLRLLADASASMARLDARALRVEDDVREFNRVVREATGLHADIGVRAAADIGNLRVELHQIRMELRDGQGAQGR